MKFRNVLLPGKEMLKKVLLITAGHLSSCPRLLKEAELLSYNGYSVGVVYLESIETIAKLDEDIKKENPNWNFYPVHWYGKKANILNTFTSKVLYKLNLIFKFNSNYIQSTSKILIDKVVNIKADFYIAHHPSVLVAAALAAKKYKSMYSYDIEDAFAYIESDEHNPNLSILRVEKKYIGGASIITTASPLYNEIYLKNYPNIVIPIRLLNVFNKKDVYKIIYKDRVDTNKISFYWYSQTIGLNRGLQDLFVAINGLPDNSFELHLRGFYTNETKETLLNLVKSKTLKENIYFHNPVSAVELYNRNIEHDVGFALEYGTSLNRLKCITNKILDYIRSGLMVIATNTEGHLYILNDFGDDACLYESGDVDSLKNILLRLIYNPDIVKKSKLKSISLANEKYNWTLESRQWIDEVNKLLK